MSCGQLFQLARTLWNQYRGMYVARQVSTGERPMLVRMMVMSSALLALAPQAVAHEQQGALRRVSCSVVRYYVTKYSAAAAETWARSHGATEADIDAARHCLKNTPGPPLQAAGWTGQQ